MIDPRHSAPGYFATDRRGGKKMGDIIFTSSTSRLIRATARRDILRLMIGGRREDGRNSLHFLYFQIEVRADEVLCAT
jgi:hypothetical protein